MHSPSTQQLSVAELVVLRDPNAAHAREALKLTLMDLMARHILLQHQDEKRGFMGSRQISTHYQLAVDARQRAPQLPHVQALLLALYDANAAQGCDMQQIVAATRRQFGNDLSRFQSAYITPSLIQRGLLETYQAKILWIIPVTRLRHTTAGEIALQQFNSQVEEARGLPAMLTQNPAHAAALVLGLGGGILLIDELRSHYGQISATMRQFTSSGTHSSTASYGDSYQSIPESEREYEEEEGEEEVDAFAFSNFGSLGIAVKGTRCRGRPRAETTIAINI